MKTAEFVALMALCAAFGGALIGYVAYRYLGYLRRIKCEARMVHQGKLDQVVNAFEGRRKLAYPVALMSADDFEALGSLRAHEEVREKLCFIDELDELKRTKLRIVFLSHEWVAPRSEPPHPDPEARQYRAMVIALRAVLQHTGWRRDGVRVWCGEHRCGFNAHPSPPPPLPVKSAPACEECPCL